MASEGLQAATALEIPDLDLVPGAGDAASTVWGHRHGPDWASMAPQGLQFAAALEIPDLESSVLGGADGASTILRHRHGVDPVASVAPENEEAVCRTGGKDSYWARATRRAIENASDPLREQHAREMRDRDETRGHAVLEVLGHYRAQLEAAAEIPDDVRRHKREATLEAAKKRELAAVYRRIPNQSFRS